MHVRNTRLKSQAAVKVLHDSACDRLRLEDSEVLSRSSELNLLIRWEMRVSMPPTGFK